MAAPNYAFAKKQRELAQKKKEEKLRKKTGRTEGDDKARSDDAPQSSSPQNG